FTVLDLAQDELRLRRQVFSKIFDELARAVGTVHLTVSEHIRNGQERVLEKVDTKTRVIRRPVVSVGEVKRVNVPLRGGVVSCDDLVGQTIGARNHGPAGFSGLKERVPIDLTSDHVVDD